MKLRNPKFNVVQLLFGIGIFTQKVSLWLYWDFKTNSQKHISEFPGATTEDKSRFACKVEGEAKG